MQILTLDTYEIVARLTKSGLSEETAKTIVDAIKVPYGEFATKSDLALLEQALKADIASVEQTLKAEIASVEQSLRGEIKSVEQRLETKMADLKAELIKWMLGMFIAQAGLLFTLLKFVH
jgi:hypothetical protein